MLPLSPVAAWRQRSSRRQPVLAPPDDLPQSERNAATCSHCTAAAAAASATQHGALETPLLSPLSHAAPHLSSLPTSFALSSTLFTSFPPLLPRPPPSRIDAQQRRREKLAFDSLERLAAETGDCGTATAANIDSDASCALIAQQQRERDKVSARCSAARIARLERLLSQAVRSNETLSAEISWLFARERQSAQLLDASRALDSAGLLSDRLVSVQLEAHTGRLLYANAIFFAVTGFTPGGVLRRVMSCIDPSSLTGVRRPHQAGLEAPLVRAPPGRANSGT